MAKKQTEQPRSETVLSRDERLKQANNLIAQGQEALQVIKAEIEAEEQERKRKWKEWCMNHIDMLIELVPHSSCSCRNECAGCLLRDAKEHKDKGHWSEWPEDVQVEINIRYVDRYR